MKILYKQSGDNEYSSLNRFGVHNCYFKELFIDRDHSCITKKKHHHMGFELHIIMDGCQEYKVCENIYKLESGSFILIYPNTPHKVVLSLPNTKKFSITFNKSIIEHTDCYFGTLTKHLSQNIDFILNESLIKKEISSTLIENNILEIIVLVFRSFGIKEKDKVYIQDKNMIISLAKKFIDDNIKNSPSVLDVAEYCYLSAKQLTRIFYKFEGISPGEYITNKRVLAVEKLLADNSFSLKQISEIMGFNNEHYFNAFFKKNSGMPPGEYRKMLGK